MEFKAGEIGDVSVIVVSGGCGFGVTMLGFHKTKRSFMDKNGNKDFKGWIIIKDKIHDNGKIRVIRNGEIWWCAVGENVGTEICGKGKIFARPVLILRKLNKYSFIGVPLTSKHHKGSWYVTFDFKNRLQTAIVSQVENISVFRLYNKIGEVPDSDLESVRDGLFNLFLKNTP